MSACVIVTICLVFGLLVVRVSDSTSIDDDESSLLLRSSRANMLGFDSAFQVAYDEVIYDSETSCRSKSDSHCYHRQRVDFSDFPFKSRGGLTDSDRQLIADLYYGAESVFEFGIGESTEIAAMTNLPRYAGVDSSAEWISTAQLQAPDRFRFSFADVGPTREWGNPTSNNTLAKMALNYQLAPLRIERDAFDVYFVDGRWRVACVMVSFLHAIQSGGDVNEIRVILHDYAGRGGPKGSYGIVESIATIEKRSEKAVVLALKGDVTTVDLFNLWKVCAAKRKHVYVSFACFA